MCPDPDSHRRPPLVELDERLMLDDCGRMRRIGPTGTIRLTVSEVAGLCGPQLSCRDENFGLYRGGDCAKRRKETRKELRRKENKRPGVNARVYGWPTMSSPAIAAEWKRTSQQDRRPKREVEEVAFVPRTAKASITSATTRCSL
jgi:hypothetical protein